MVEKQRVKEQQRRPQRRNIRSKTLRILLKPIRIDMLAGRFGKRFGRLVETQKRVEQARVDKLNLVRSIITREKTRILREIKGSEPSSIYELARNLNRDLKSVRGDVKQLEKIGFIRLIKHKERGSKIRKVRPVLAIGKLNISIEFV